jgi:hypothetical protein
VRKVDETPKQSLWDWLLIMALGGLFGLVVALKYMGTL